ncbi:hypothetical protein HPG69_013990 [Diceros bicornis minor]|uniref:Uncharacterized protein n=1 Tax=Diceros bicornis minor TaxID=77932 RepID=A0A7J7EMP9_DICBM|nr:hypothetical protein HPG69_013990 [Diceros bicornis minor]
MSSFGWHQVFNDFGCKLFPYVRAVGRVCVALFNNPNWFLLKINSSPKYNYEWLTREYKQDMLSVFSKVNKL